VDGWALKESGVQAANLALQQASASTHVTKLLSFSSFQREWLTPHNRDETGRTPLLEYTAKMDLLSSIRKEGSRGGVDFKWSDVTTSQHRENYLGHSLMAPVGRWQKNRDLTWYAKADSGPAGSSTETAEEKKAREKREEMRRIKEAEEDALARALGLPVVDRGTNSVGTGANSIDVGEVKRVIKETEVGDDEIEDVGRGRGFGGFVGKMDTNGPDRSSELDINIQKGGLMGGDSTPRRVKRPARAEDRSRSRSRSRDRRHRRHTHHERSRERDSGGGRYLHRERDTDSRAYERRNRSHSPHLRERQYRSRNERERKDRSRSPQIRRERSRSPARKEERRYRSRSRSSSPPRRDRRDDRERDRDRRGLGAEYRAAQSRRSRPPDPRERESRRGVGERWR